MSANFSRPHQTSTPFSKWIFILITVTLVTLTIGNPLLFSGLTRSVFEVNKLLLFRITSLITLFLWILHYFYITDTKQCDHTPQNAYQTRLFSWKKIGLEPIILIWIFLNLVSSLFSPSIHVSLIGAYDRWEGLFTLINYILLLLMVAKLVIHKYQLFWILGGLICATGLSAYYGVLQSTGYDFMNWNADPTFRVFACINNPVHFCAFVGMVTLTAIGVLFFLIQRRTPFRALPACPPPVLMALKGIYLIASMAVALSVLDMNWVSLQSGLMIGLVGLGCVIAETDDDIPPMLTWRMMLKWAAYIGIVAAASQIPVLALTHTQYIAVFTVLSPYLVMTAYPYTAELLKRTCFLLIGLIFFTMYLSFTRATWIGFYLSAPLFFIFAVLAPMYHHPRTMLTAFFSIVGMCISHTLLYNFNLYKISSPLSTGFITLYGLSYAVLLMTRHHRSWQSFLFPMVLMLGILGAFHFSEFPLFMRYIILFSTLIFVRFTHHRRELIYAVPLLITFCSQLQYISLSLFNFVAFISLLLTISFLLRHLLPGRSEFMCWYTSVLFVLGLAVMPPQFNNFCTQLSGLLLSTSWPALIGVLCIISALMALMGQLFLPHSIRSHRYYNPLLAVLIVTLIGSGCGVKYQLTRTVESDSFEIQNRYSRTVGTLENQLSESARIGMWRSVPEWVSDYWLLGSGPDTIKFMYPKYRHYSYGILEGGHNFIPDKLHNEYLNTLVTRGIPGFLVYYLGIILGWVIIVVRGCVRFTQSPYLFVILGLLSSAGIYLGQVLFNFGVVATLVLFYTVMGLAWAIVSHPSFTPSPSQPDTPS